MSTSTGPRRNLQNGTGHCSLRYIYTRYQIYIYSNNFMKVNRWSDKETKTIQYLSKVNMIFPEIYRCSLQERNHIFPVPVFSNFGKPIRCTTESLTYGQDMHHLDGCDVHISRKKRRWGYVRCCNLQGSFLPNKALSALVAASIFYIWPYQLPAVTNSFLYLDSINSRMASRALHPRHKQKHKHKHTHIVCDREWRGDKSLPR